MSRWAELLLDKVRNVLETVLQEVLNQLWVRELSRADSSWLKRWSLWVHELSRAGLSWLKRSSIKRAGRRVTAIHPLRRG